MHHELRVYRDDSELSDAAAQHVAQTARRAVAEDGVFHLAVSGGRSPWQMFERLGDLDVPWANTVVWQTDERLAPPDDPDRNLTHLIEALHGHENCVRPMPVDDPDVDAAAERYADALPGAFHLVHLGLGPDGHTASLVPTDPVLDVHDQTVALTAAYTGRRRMTLTYPGLARARELLWLVSGSSKQDALRRLLEGDREIPAGRVEAGASIVMADRDASLSEPA